jgi:hypothetical protein
MARIIPNENTWVGFIPGLTSLSNYLSPTETEIATLSTDVTPFLMSINASSQGNTVPTPSFDSLFETSIIGTSQATFTADFYRDDVADTAWTTLPRGTAGYFVVSRFGGSGTDQIPVAGDTCEVWPVNVVSRTAANMQNNAVQTFTIQCSVNIVPAESAVVTGSASVPSVPQSPIEAVQTGATTATVDWSAPVFVGAGLVAPYYKIYRDSAPNGTFSTLCTATITGTSGAVTGLTTATGYYFKVKATNSVGDSALSAVSNLITTA